MTTLEARIQHFVSSFRSRLRQMEEGLTFVELLGIIAGVIGGLGAVVFRLLINVNQTIFFSYLLPHITFFGGSVNLGIMLLPAIGGLIVGPLVTKFAPEARGHGVPEVMNLTLFMAEKLGRELPSSRALLDRSLWVRVEVLGEKGQSRK